MIERTGIFIDGGYLLSTLRRDFRLKDEFPLNLLKMAKDLIQRAQAGRLQRAYYYDCPPYKHAVARPGDEERAERKRLLFEWINSLPNFEVRLGELKLVRTPGGGEEYVQKGVDMLLGIDLVRMASKGAISDAILITGDADFVPAVEIAKDEGVNVTCATGETFAAALVKLCDDHVQLTPEMIEAWLPKR